MNGKSPLTPDKLHFTVKESQTKQSQVQHNHEQALLERRPFQQMTVVAEYLSLFTHDSDGLKETLLATISFRAGLSTRKITRPRKVADPRKLSRSL